MVPVQYVAGFSDGEGCVMISSELRVNVSITQVRRNILDLIQKDWGGRVAIHRQPEGNRRQCHVWNLCGADKVKGFLSSILPYLVVKKEEAKLGIEACGLMRKNNRGCVPLTPDEIQARSELRQTITSFRQRSDFRHDSMRNKSPRDAIKEKHNYICKRCGTDLSGESSFHHIILGKKLYCRSCNQRLANHSKKPMSKEIVSKAITESNSMDMAAQKLGINRSSLYQQRKRHGILDLQTKGDGIIRKKVHPGDLVTECLLCGRSIEGKGEDARFCSAYCLKRDHYVRHRKQYLARAKARQQRTPLARMSGD